MGSSADDLRGNAGRLLALARAGISAGTDTEPHDRLADLARQITGAGAAFISIVEVDRDFYLGQSGLPEPLATTRTLHGETFCSLNLDRSTPLAIDDTRADPMYASVPTVTSLGIAAYVGAPIRSIEGETLGSFCLVDFSPRCWTPVEIELVTQLALAAEREISLRHPETGVAAAQQSQALMRIAGVLARVAGWALDVSDNSVHWSDEIHEILERDSIPEFDTALDMYPPGERERVEAALAACSSAGVPFDLMSVVRTHAGNELKVRIVGEPEYDDCGQVVRVVGALQDITHMRRVEEQLLQAQRLESIGTLAGGIAHDINNVLTPIMLAVDLLHDEIVDPDHAAILESVQSSALRGSKLIQQVLLFARGAEGQRVALTVGNLLDSTEAIVTDTFSKSLALRASSDDEVRNRMVMVEPTQLQQVLLNLCVNARDAIGERGTITLGADVIEIDEQYVASSPDVVEGVYVVLRVEDDGSGMPTEVLDRCFEPFFTTKQHGQGTGLGLSTSLAIVKSHGGFMRASSEPGRGTTFRIYLPLTRETPTDSETAPKSEIIRGNGELILLVDDESSVLEVTAQTLRTFGYQVVTAVDGADAVAVFAQRSLEIDLVLTDMMMPVMDGAATVQVIKRIRPDVPIVAASGLDANGSTSKMSELGVTHFLSKPYSAQNLLHVLSTALSQS